MHFQQQRWITANRRGPHLPLTSSRVFWSKASFSKTVVDFTKEEKQGTLCALFRNFSYVIYGVPSNLLVLSSGKLKCHREKLCLRGNSPVSIKSPLVSRVVLCTAWPLHPHKAKGAGRNRQDSNFFGAGDSCAKGTGLISRFLFLI